MPDRRPFRFGVQSFSASSAAEWRDKARRAEDFGYAVLSLADHFIGPGPAQESTNHPPQELAAVPAIAVAAEATTRLRLGCRVFCVDYRHPVMLTKEAATLDLLSEGRLEVGLGAGWLADEYAAAGIPFERASVDAVWKVLPAAFQALGIPGRVMDAGALVYGNDKVTETTVAGRATRDLFRCGATSGLSRWCIISQFLSI